MVFVVLSVVPVSRTGLPAFDRPSKLATPMLGRFVE